MMVQPSHLYVTTGKTIALARWTFVNKVISLLLNMLCRFVIAYLPRSKHLLTSWLQSPSAVVWEFKKIKSVTVSIVFPSICHKVIGPDTMEYNLKSMNMMPPALLFFLKITWIIWGFFVVPYKF